MSVNRCPRCARPRVAGFRYCPACAFDYNFLHEEEVAGDAPPPAAWERRKDDFYVRPASPAPPTWAEHDRDMQRDIARYSLARWSLGCRMRAAGCLGLIVGFIVGALLAGVLAPNGSNPVLALALVFGGAIAGAWIAQYRTIRNIAR